MRKSTPLQQLAKKGQKMRRKKTQAERRKRAPEQELQEPRGREKVKREKADKKARRTEVKEETQKESQHRNGVRAAFHGSVVNHRGRNAYAAARMSFNRAVKAMGNPRGATYEQGNMQKVPASLRAWVAESQKEAFDKWFAGGCSWKALLQEQIDEDKASTDTAQQRE